MLRRVLAVVVVLALGSLAAFGPTPAGAQGPKVLRVATDTNLPWLDPHMGTAFTLRELSSHVFEGLVTIGEDYGVIPQLAESWTVSADGMDYTFKLRPGVKFHNGRTVTAEDVKASVDRFVQFSARRGDLGAVQAVTVVDPLDRADLAQGGAGLVPRRPGQPGGPPRDHAEGARDGREGSPPAPSARRHRAFPPGGMGA